MTSPRDPPSHRVFAALYDPAMRSFEQEVLPPHREYLAANLSGTVLDMGVGTGAMFPYFATHGDSATFHGIEPDPHMRKRAKHEAEEHGIDIEIRDIGAEALPYDDDTFDVVIASIVFCTIPDVKAALDEVARVLAANGELRFLEHVKANGTFGQLQELASPVWQKVAGGCHPDRETTTVISSHPAFEIVGLERIDAGSALARPFIRGTATVHNDT